MKWLAALLLFFAPACAWAYIMPNFEPKELAQSDTILYVPVESIKASYFPDTPGGIVGPVKTTWDIVSPVVLKGTAGPTVHLQFTDYYYPYQANKSGVLIFLRQNGAELEPASTLGWAVGVSGDPAKLATELQLTKPAAWSLLAQCLTVEKDPACALHLSYILSDAPPDVLQTTWATIKDRKNAPPDLWLAYQNIGLHVVGVSALDGFVEPGVQEEASNIDKDGSRMARYQIVDPMCTWLYYGRDTEDYHHLLAFARNQRGRLGEAAMRGTERLTQMSDLPQLVDIFEHAPSVDIRYACLEHFYRILNRPYPSGIPGVDEFKKREATYRHLWEKRIAAVMPPPTK